MGIIVYTGGFIDKASRAKNRVLANKLRVDLIKSLKIPKNAVKHQELNTFLVLKAEKSYFKDFDKNIFTEVDKGSAFRRFSDYSKNVIESQFRILIQKNPELRETSSIVLEFLREVDPRYLREFSKKWQTVSRGIPKQLSEITNKTFMTLWEIEEESKYRVFLSGLNQSFSGSTSETSLNPQDLLDEFIMVNFFAVFLSPTVKQLNDMIAVLKELEPVLSQHCLRYRVTNKRLQKKAELFLRILAAKLSALQDLERLFYRIFNLFEIPKIALQMHDIKNDFFSLNDKMVTLAEEVRSGKAILHQVSEKIESCQLALRDYMVTDVNEVITTESLAEFKKSIRPLADLSIDLLIKAETLKLWADFFGSDIPFFSFNISLFGSVQHHEPVEIDEDILLSVRGLFKNYNLGRTTVYAVRGVNIDIRVGEFVCIMGSSGAGKTTLLNCIAGLDTPDHGIVLFNGKNLHKIRDREKSRIRLLEMGFIFQMYALLPHYNTRENVALPADIAGLSHELRERIEDLLKGVGIDGQALQFPSQLSGGQMQRVSIARALTNKPKVIFADEPTGDLDSATGKQVMDLLKKFHEETGTTIIVITHDPDVANYAQRLIQMKDGVLIH